MTIKKKKVKPKTKTSGEVWKIERLSGLPLQKREFRAQDNKICRGEMKGEKYLRIYEDLTGF